MRLNSLKQPIYEMQQVAILHGLPHALIELPRFVYNPLFRPLLPKSRKAPRWGGVKIDPSVRSRRVFDGLLPWTTPGDKPNYEFSLIRSLKNQTREGDIVVIIGGGIGVTAVISSRLVGNSGRVIVYEASADQVPIIKKTLSLNDSNDNVEIRHGLVGESEQVYGDIGKAEQVDPDDLPSCDVLELDCEGSEAQILESQNLPDKVVVETHGFLGVDTQESQRRLMQKGYEVNIRPQYPPKGVDVIEAFR